eukprot:gene6935-9566_t
MDILNLEGTEQEKHTNQRKEEPGSTLGEMSTPQRYLLQRKDGEKLGLGLQRFLVTNVAPNGPADRAGLKPGMRISSIQGTSTDGLSHVQITNLIKKSSGKELELIVGGSATVLSTESKKSSTSQNPSRPSISPSAMTTQSTAQSQKRPESNVLHSNREQEVQSSSQKSTLATSPPEPIVNSNGPKNVSYITNRKNSYNPTETTSVKAATKTQMIMPNNSNSNLSSKLPDDSSPTTSIPLINTPSSNQTASSQQNKLPETETDDDIDRLLDSVRVAATQKMCIKDEKGGVTSETILNEISNILVIGTFFLGTLTCFTNSVSSTKNGNSVQIDAPLCTSCNKPILTRYLEYSGRKYHRGCFLCHGCKSSLAECSFTVSDGRLVCQKCWAKENGLLCVGCSEMIIPDPDRPVQYVTLNDKHYHKECVKCSQCGIVFGPSISGSILCKEHATERRKSRSSVDINTNENTGERKLSDIRKAARAGWK